MPTCKQCSGAFPNVKVIDGKKRILNSRRYCLDCSPFRKHNTRRIHLGPDEPFAPLKGVKRTCEICQKIYIFVRNGATRYLCNSCAQRVRQRRVKGQCIDLLGGKCQDCGYSRSVEALSFHHLDPGKKDFKISGCYNRAWKVLKKEILKCVLLCSNCHIERHAKIFAGQRPKIPERFRRVKDHLVP